MSFLRPLAKGQRLKRLEMSGVVPKPRPHAAM